MRIDLRQYVAQLRFIVPLVTLGTSIYAMWVYIHKFCIKQLYRKYHRHSAGIALIVVVSVLQLLVLFIWWQIWYSGCGEQVPIPPFRINKPFRTSNNDCTAVDIIPPKLYPCDVQGYPIWCSSCGSVKSFRTHHSSQKGHCVERFDHYCPWLGTVIGKGNYPLFIKYLIYCSIQLIIVAVSVVIFLPKNFRNDGNLITIVVLAFLAMCFTLTMLVIHIYYMSRNVTSIEMINLQRERKRLRKKSQDQTLKLMHVCYKGAGCVDEEGKTVYNRYVVALTYKEYTTIWNKDSILANLQDSMSDKNPIKWLIPYPQRTLHGLVDTFHFENKEQDLPSNSIFFDDIFKTSDKINSLLQDKISRRDYVRQFEAWGDSH